MESDLVLRGGEKIVPHHALTVFGLASKNFQSTKFFFLKRAPASPNPFPFHIHLSTLFFFIS